MLCVSDHITVEQLKRYASVMKEDEQAGDRPQAAVRSMARLLPDVYKNTRPAEILQAPVIQVVTAAKTLHFTMQNVVIPKIETLSDEPEVEREASAFDGYDREEGYEDEEEEGNLWDSCLEAVEVITRASIRLLRQSYTDTMQEEVGPLIDHIKWEIDNRPQQEGG